MSHLANFHGVQAVALHDTQQGELIQSLRLTQVILVFGFMASSFIQTAYTLQRLDGVVIAIFDMNRTVSEGLHTLEAQLGGSVFRLDQLYISVEAILGEVKDLDALTVNITGDDFNITMELGELEETAKLILQDMRIGQSNIVQAIQASSNLTDDIFNSEDGWGHTVKDHLEDADDFLSAISDSIDIIHDIIDTVGAIIQGVQQITLKGILEALQGGAFNEKVFAAVSETEWSLEVGNLEMTLLEATALETADVLLDACVSALGEGPIECVGGEFMEFAIEGLAAEGLTSSSAKLQPMVKRMPPPKTKRPPALPRYLNSCTFDPRAFPNHLDTCPSPSYYVTSSPCP